MLYRGEIIDSHMHLWNLDLIDYPWLQKADPVLEIFMGDYKGLRQNFLMENYHQLIKNQNVTKSVHIEANPKATQGLQETAWLQKQADTYGFPHGIVVYADLSDPDLEQILKKHLEYPNVRGVRQILYRPTDSTEKKLLCENQWKKGLALLAQYDLSFELALFDHQLPAASKVAKEYSDTRFVIDHLGFPFDINPEGFQHWKERLALMADLANVSFKISGIGSVLKTTEVKILEPYVLTAIEVFGEDRCFFGSNFPPDKLFCDYGKLLENLKKIVSGLDGKKLFYSNAKKFYRL